MVKIVCPIVAPQSTTCFQNCVALNFSAITTCAPTIRAGSTPSRLASPWNSGSGVNRMSSRVIPSARMNVIVEEKKCPFGSITPFEGPVVPDVYMTLCRSRNVHGTSGSSPFATNRSAWKSR